MTDSKSDINLLLFFGSGISFPTGLPCIQELTSQILDGQWHDHTDQNFYKGKHPNKFFEEDNIVPKLQKFLKIIQEDADQYLVKRNRPKANYEDLYFICNQIRDELKQEIDNPVMSNYVESIQNKLGDLLEPLPHTSYLDIDLQLLASKSCDLIHCVLWNELSTKKRIVGLDLLIKMIKLRGIIKINIVTLNHDLLIETLLENSNINFTDGFDTADGDVRWFSPNLYLTSNEKVSLYKLHGSINWHVFRTIDQSTGNGVDRFAMAISPDVDHCRISNGQSLHNISNTPKILTGSYNKMLDYNFGIIKQIHNKFDVMLDNHNTIIMSGYSWNDRGINGRLFDWLFSSENNRIILLHKRPNDIRNKSKSAMWHRYERLVSNNKLILIKKWFCDTTLEEIIEIL